MIPYARQDISQADIDAVVAVLRSDFLTQGPTIADFEQAVAARTTARHAVAANSATSALHIACLALGLGPGDRLWTVPNTYVASANCGRYCGAEVDFVDIDARTYNLSTEALAAKLAAAECSGTLPKVLVAVHFGGQSCDMQAIHALAVRYRFRILEDASHAIGGTYRSGAVGSCAYSDISVFSFHPVKIITSAEGGMALTNDAELAARMRRLRTHGVTREPALMRRTGQGAWYYEQLDLGFNYRMTEIQAALGFSQLQRIDEFLARRRQIAAAYDRRLADLPLILPFQHPDAESAFHLYPVQVDDARTRLDRATLVERLRELGVAASVHYIPVHTQPYYQRLGFRQGQFPQAEKYYSRTASLPMYASLSASDVDAVVSAVHRACGAWGEHAPS
jgi:UDP-4-amino-4,6-dideoxy-N-acetyl-beta-L-altrosamine transaminase